MSSTPPTDGAPHWQRNLYRLPVRLVHDHRRDDVAAAFPAALCAAARRDHSAAAAVQWSGVAFGATFLAAALVSPLWGRMADRYGRKLILIRASLGMAVVMSLLGLAQNVWQLVGLRFLAGLVGGYASGATVMVATQTPSSRTGWALGTLASGVMAGNLVGPADGRRAAAADRHPQHVLHRRRDDLLRVHRDHAAHREGATGRPRARQGARARRGDRLGQRRRTCGRCWRCCSPPAC